MLTFEMVNKLLRYDPEMGKLYWRISSAKRIKVGSEAGSLSKSTGYITIRIEGKLYQAHRVAWLLHEGHWPEGNPEHENQNKSDNCWKNICDLATKSENGANQVISNRNTSGLKGVTWHSQISKWRSQIKVRGEHIHLVVSEDHRLAGLTYDAAAKAVWGLRFSNLNFPTEESDHIVLPERVIRRIDTLRIAVLDLT